MREWWGRRRGLERVVIGSLGVVLALNVAIVAVDRATGGSPSGPVASSYATAPDGVAAWADLLVDEGRRVVRLREPVDAGIGARATTLVVLDPDELAPAELDAIEAFVHAGGRLVAGGPAALPLAVRFAEVRWEPGASTVAAPLVPTPEVAGVATVRTDGAGRWAEVGGALPVLAADGDVVLAVARPGAGRVALLADTSPLRNRRLAEADAAALALALAGPPGSTVAFAEAAHGYGRSEGGLLGLGHLPGRWRTAVLLGALATAVLLWSRGVRLGPAEDEAGAPPPRRRYVDALAATAAKGRPSDEAVDPLRERARARLRTGAGALLAEDDRAALEAPVHDERSMVAMGRAAARLEVGG